MNGNQITNKKDWKDWLLKSSLPLEQLVSEALDGRSMYIAGEYSYVRPNEHAINTEFSVDLHAFKLLGQQLQSDPLGVKYSTKFNLLVECKYNHEGVKWVFSPYYVDSFLGTQLNIFRIQKLWKHFDVPLDTEAEIYFPFCARGIEIHGSGYDPNGISHGLSQLRYAMPMLIQQEADELNHGISTVEQSLICLMLVTTADLYVLKNDQNIEKYRLAMSLEDVASKVDAVVVLQERGAHLQQYCEELLERPYKGRYTDDREKSVLKQRVDNLFPGVFQTIVVSLSALGDSLDKIEAAIKKLI